MRPTSRLLERWESPYALPQKLRFDFSKNPGWVTRFRSWSWQKTLLSSELGQAWPAEIADVPEFQPNPRIVIGEDGGWLSSVRSRLGRCISFGLVTPRVRQAGKLLRTLGADTETAGWRGLTLKRYGFSFNEGKPYSLLVRGQHPLLKRALVHHQSHFDDFVYETLLENQRMYWFRNFTMSKFGHVRGKEKLPRGPTGNLTVCHRLRPGFVRPDGTMQNHFSIDSLVVSARQERVIAQATASFSFVARVRVPEPERFDELVAHYFLSMMMDQERLRAHTEKKISKIEDELRSIEKSSWDREGAVEDLGTAAMPEQAEQEEEVGEDAVEDLGSTAIPEQVEQKEVMGEDAVEDLDTTASAEQVEQKEVQGQDAVEDLGTAASAEQAEQKEDVVKEGNA
ncbi:uncharacterized protein J3D65DRAFT_672347 [Phyllosticta citribraziliensis]|uniref:Uncharacterized protein n=1 Tax=Phyllosticta citribraziliensis TaxID=989973 RepID=A0ABR1L3Z6_9PEZI